MKSLPDGIVIIMKFENWLQVSYAAFFEDITRDSPTKYEKVDESPNLHAFIHDARRFAIYNRLVIKQAPL
jgi:hypothetical protein